VAKGQQVTGLHGLPVWRQHALRRKALGRELAGLPLPARVVHGQVVQRQQQHGVPRHCAARQLKVSHGGAHELRDDRV
jgi:hypothetical protein